MGNVSNKNQLPQSVPGGSHFVNLQMKITANRRQDKSFIMASVSCALHKLTQTKQHPTILEHASEQFSLCGCLMFATSISASPPSLGATAPIPL